MRKLKIDQKDNPPAGKLDPAQRKALIEIGLFFGGVLLIGIGIFAWVMYNHPITH